MRRKRRRATGTGDLYVWWADRAQLCVGSRITARQTQSEAMAGIHDGFGISAGKWRRGGKSPLACDVHCHHPTPPQRGRANPGRGRIFTRVRQPVTCKSRLAALMLTTLVWPYTLQTPARHMPRRPFLLAPGLSNRLDTFGRPRGQALTRVFPPSQGQGLDECLSMGR